MWCGVKQRIDEALGQTQSSMHGASAAPQWQSSNGENASFSKHENENHKVGF